MCMSDAMCGIINQLDGHREAYNGISAPQSDLKIRSKETNLMFEHRVGRRNVDAPVSIL